MGVFEQLLGGLIGQLGTGPQRNALLDLAANVITEHPGGLAGIVEQFTKAGLGREAGSWVGTGKNLPISAEQLTKALGQDNVRALGQKLGVPQGPPRVGWRPCCQSSSTS